MGVWWTHILYFKYSLFVSQVPLSSAPELQDHKHASFIASDFIYLKKQNLWKKLLDMIALQARCISHTPLEMIA